MIYLDNAATTLQKPPEVIRAVVDAMKHCGSVGRGGHPAALRAAELVWQCREECSHFFGVSSPERVIFTSNATHGLNLAVRNCVHSGDEVLISGYEHNAVTRTLHQIPQVQITVTSKGLFEPSADLEALQEHLARKRPSAVIWTHVSNVFGYVLPIQEAAECCRNADVPLIVDASQSAGILPIDLEKWGAAYVAMPGHKGLLGPQGTGLLLCGSGTDPTPLLCGGTGSESRLQEMPEFVPDRLEAGTHNVPGIAGMLAGLRFVKKKGLECILNYERGLIRALTQGMSEMKGVKLYLPSPKDHTGVLSFSVQGQDCEELAAGLAESGYCLRAGLHCAPLAHMTAGTLDTGTLRLSLSPFNHLSEIKQFLKTFYGELEN